MLKTNNNNLISGITLEWIIAISLTVPTYIIYFIGKEPIIQGIAFCLYWIPLCVIINKKRKFDLSLKFIFIWLFFLVLWIVPSIINRMSSNLESDLVSLPVLFYHVLMLSVIIIFFAIYTKNNKKNDKDFLMQALFWTLVPLVVLIFFKILYLEYLEYKFNDRRLNPFNVNANTSAELIFTFMLLTLRISNNYLRIIGIVLAITSCYLLESRGGLFSCYIALIFSYGLPWIKLNLNWKNTITFIFSAIAGFLLFQAQINLFVNKIIFQLVNDESMTIRFQMWDLAIKSITEKPFIGIGFWVNPMGYSVPDSFSDYVTLDHYHYVIHNAFLRIATENGILICLLIMCLIIISCFNLYKKNAFKDLAVIISILFFLFFSTRHLTINLMNIILYFVVIRSLISNKNYFKK